MPTGFVCPTLLPYVLNGNTCYLFDSAPILSLQACNSYCYNAGGGMLCPHDSTEDNYIYSQRTGTDYWLGFSKIRSPAWTNEIINMPESNCFSSYRNVRSGGSSTLDYAGFIQSEYLGGQWEDSHYEHTHLCYCQADAVMSGTPAAQPTPQPSYFDKLGCEEGFVRFGDTCFKLRGSPQLGMNDCKAHCSGLDASMLCPKNSQENDFIFTSRTGFEWWYGYTKASGTNTIIPLPGSGCNGTYHPLRAGEGTVSDELAFIGSAEDAGWSDFPDNRSYLCYCQKPVVLLYSDQPTSQPSTQPSVAHLPTIVSAPDFHIRNGFAFAARATGGAVFTWGEAPMGGNSSLVAAQLTSGVREVVHMRFAFAAVKNDGSVTAWGAAPSLRGATAAFPPVGSVTCHEDACAMIADLDGSVHAFGSKYHGGAIGDTARCPGCAAALAAGVASISATSAAFAALFTNGDVYAWGSKYTGGAPSAEVQAQLRDVRMVVGSHASFAALLRNGRVVTWGDRLSGGDTSAVDAQLTEVWHIASSRSTFLAHRKTGGLVVWGYAPYSDTSDVTAQLAANVTYVAHTFAASAALKADGSVVTWGKDEYGGDSSAVQVQLTGIVQIVGNSRAFAAVNAAGGVVAWGTASYGGEIPANKVAALSSGVVSISHTDRAFAALKSDRSVVVWGQAGHGGSPGTAVEALLSSGVHTICANDVAFSAIKTDGSVVGWGHEVSVPAPGVQFTSATVATPVECQ